jgi:putative ABC transport system permease protein
MTRRRQPPRVAEWIIGRATGGGPWTDTILGDLYEEHARIAARHPRLCTAWYWAQAVRLALRYSATRVRAAARRPDHPHVPATPQGDSQMRSVLLETRHAVRAMLKRPATTAVVVLTLALGLGANAAIFAIIDALVIRPFRFPEPDRIALVAETEPDGSTDRQETTSPANFLDWRKQTDAIDHFSAFEWWDVNVVGRDEPERVQGFQVSAGFFPALGVQPALGRGFVQDEETFGRHRTAVLGHGLWMRRFAGDPAVIGQQVNLNGAQYEIVGVAPRGFDFPNGSEVWAPLAFDAKTAALRTSRYLTAIGRLAPGRTIEDAQAQIAVVAERLAQTHPDTQQGRGARVYTLTQGMMDQGLGPILSMWQASAVFVLLIACANIANLLLARGAERQRDLAVRLAIGASRARIVRQLLIESVILGLLAVPGALAAAYVALQILVSYMPARIARFVPGWHDIDVDGRLLAFTAILGIGTAVVFGLLPALQSSRPRLSETLKDGGRGATAGRHRLRRGLVIVEVALALPLLVSSGLSAIGVNRFLNGPQGFDQDNLLTLRAALSEGRHPDAESWRTFTRASVDRLGALPGVRTAAVMNVIPAGGGNRSRPIEIEGQPNSDPSNPPFVDYRSATPGAFDALQIPILTGRGIVDADRHDTQPIAVVSQSLAARYWPGADPIGRRLRIANGEWLTVVGVCGDVIHDWFARRNHPTLYRPYDQAPTSYGVFLVRAAADPASLVKPARAAIHAVDPLQPVYDVRTMREVLKERTIGLQYVAVIMGVFGGFALLLAIVGVYSVMAYLVTQRRHEIGVRIALGATPRDVLKLTVGQAGRLTALGVAAGSVLAVALGRLIEAGLVGTVSTDPRVVAGFGAVLILAALVAGYLPARRAAATDPAVALRAD